MPFAFLKALRPGHNNSMKKLSSSKSKSVPIQVNGKPISSPKLIGSSTSSFLASSNEQKQRQQQQQKQQQQQQQQHMSATPPPLNSSLTLELHDVMRILELKSPLSPEEQRQRIFTAIKHHEEKPLPTLPLVLPLPTPLLQPLEDLDPASSSSSSASLSPALLFLPDPEDLVTPPSSLSDSSSFLSFESSSEQGSPVSHRSTQFQVFEYLPQASPLPPFEICMQCVIGMEQCLPCFRVAQVALPNGGDPACDGCRRGLCTPAPTPTVPLVVALAAAHSPQFGGDSDSLSSFSPSPSSSFAAFAASGTRWSNTEVLGSWRFGDHAVDDDDDGGTSVISFQVTEYLQPLVYNGTAAASESESESDASSDSCIDADFSNYVDEEEDEGIDGWVVSDLFSPWGYLTVDLDLWEIRLVDNIVIASGKARLVSIERPGLSGP